MDLTKFLGQDSQEQSAQRLSKEEYAAQKKQEREEIWGMIDGKAQEVFQNGDSLKGFLDFMGQCKPQRTDNLFLLYAQNPEIRQVKTFEKWKEEGKVVKTGARDTTSLSDRNMKRTVSSSRGTPSRKPMTSARSVPSSQKRQSQSRWTS